MAKQNKPHPKVRMERLPHRRAVERVRQAYQRLRRLATEKSTQEAENERVRSDLCARVYAAARAGSDD